MFRADPPSPPLPARAREASNPARSTPPCRVAYCGPIALPGHPAGGGYEAANRRTCDALARRGLQVLELPYPKPARSTLAKLLGYAGCYLRTGAWLVLRRGRYDLLHLTPLNMHFAAAEGLLVALARTLGKPVLLDVRAGTFVRHHESGSAWYRRTIDGTLRRASQVAVEGQAYIPFVRQRTRRPVHYFPNYIDDPALQRQALATPPGAGPVRLVYFGRMVRAKGIETALQVLALLAANGHAVELELIGDGPAEFLDEMRTRYAALPVTWTPAQPMDEVLRRAAGAHFFFFASRHDGEGHSNALNEAMSVGLVPVCSDQGFTRGVVGNAGVVLSRGATAADYAAAVEDILSAGRWERLSERARTRVRTLYSEGAAIPGLIDLYRQMLLRR